MYLTGCSTKNGVGNGEKQGEMGGKHTPWSATGRWGAGVAFRWLQCRMRHCQAIHKYMCCTCHGHTNAPTFSGIFFNVQGLHPLLGQANVFPTCLVHVSPLFPQPPPPILTHFHHFFFSSYFSGKLSGKCTIN